MQERQRIADLFIGVSEDLEEELNEIGRVLTEPTANRTTPANGREIRRLITRTLPSVIVLLIFLPWRNVFFVL